MEFLRNRRARIKPESVGLPAAMPYRRVPGLRREELARLAGVSADYYTRLEQGRNITPSEAVLDALAVALRLDPAERAHLFNLARPRPACVRRQVAPQGVRTGLHRLMDALPLQPAYVLDRRIDVLACNVIGRALMADFNAMPCKHRNLVRWMLLDESTRVLYRDWAAVTSQLVGMLRLSAGRHPNDRRTAELVDELRTKSEDFRRFWAAHRVVESTFGRKRFRHPLVGDLELDYEVLTMAADPDQLLVVYTAEPGSPSQEAVNLLAGWAMPARILRGAAGEPAACEERLGRRAEPVPRSGSRTARVEGGAGTRGGNGHDAPGPRRRSGL
ncbi:helix-turn-helix transcriptional regulator [Streptosporangium lutulentum]|uniref:Transcriptional regulator with XRE-family HTH domain n=1 Tax=Streptosporangium lutulentum TaxID=1461250 RepID=A0ABT9QCH3_9ACTN|nr:helix-turn-helix transcriptional regulator [Streptosporangium lutulentum]MDP9844085.1 transcriptional regulator with XRE-family HTH domain [Streptosporangium lutulentum]